jgi:hypothetical protein
VGDNLREIPGAGEAIIEKISRLSILASWDIIEISPKIVSK